MEPNTFAAGELDRVAWRRRDEAWVTERRAAPASRAVLAGRAGVLLEGPEDAPRPALVPLAAVGDADAALLGLDARGRAVFAADLEDGEPAAGAWVSDLRAVAARLAPADAGLLAHAVALLGWHRRTRFCPACGAATRFAEAGHLRVCTREERSLHPRTDPVVIMLVTDGDRVLLGRQAHWPVGRWSALAGFVEPGETLEQAVAREVDEEAGIRLTDVVYHSSQPWPFPGNLMLGFHARWASGEPAARDGELEAVRWFTREETAAAAAGEGDSFLPPREAIARRLVESWLDGTAGSA